MPTELDDDFYDLDKWFAALKKAYLRKDREAGAIILALGGLFILFCILSFICALATGHPMPWR